MDKDKYRLNQTLLQLPLVRSLVSLQVPEFARTDVVNSDRPVQPDLMQPTFVWGLYENHSGTLQKLVGIFSSPNLAKTCNLIQPLLTSDWQHRDVGGSYLWIAIALHPDHPQVTFYFSVEEIQLDRLAEH